AGVRVHGRLVVVQPRLDDRGDQRDHGDVLAEVVTLDHGDEELRVLLLPVVHRLRQEALAVLGAGQELLGPLAGPGLRAARSGGCRRDGAGGRCGGEAESAGGQQAAAGERGEGAGGGDGGRGGRCFGCGGGGAGGAPRA